MTIGGVRGKAIKTGGAGGSFSREDLAWLAQNGTLYGDPGLVTRGLTATGGVISDYTVGPVVYRAHVFTSSGTFDVTGPGIFGDTVDYLVVGGGGGGAGWVGGGGGGGAIQYKESHPVTVNPYAVTIGAGGYGGEYPGPSPLSDATSGGSSSIAFPATITAAGGGGGGGFNNSGDPRPGLAGGSGGGGGGCQPGQSVGGPGTGSGDPGGTGTDDESPTNGWGNDGGSGYPGPAYAGGGGAGAGANGTTAPGPAGGAGGAGLQYTTANGTATYYGGGGGGCGNSPGGEGPGGDGGGGDGGATNSAPDREGDNAVASTGGGGGGSRDSVGTNGGSGIVVVRYQIVELTGSAKATGGAISFYGDKTIHTFTGSGTFTTPASFSETVEYIVIGGGGSGGSGSANTNTGGGGGGAGTYRTASVPVSGPFAAAVTIGAGGGANYGSLGSQGGTTTLALPSSVASPGGGYGYPGPTPGYDGGSSGGTSSQSTTASGDPFPGTIGATPTSGWGHIGNNAPADPAYNGGGGGGAGGAAPPQPGGNLSPGGIGIQMPATFRDPVSGVGAPGPTSPTVTGADTSGKYYVAGGGGGSAGYPQPGGTQPKGGDGGFGGGGDGGGIDPTGNSYNGNGSNAIPNTGSGGGGGPTGDNTFAGGGGSGIVLIAYPT